MPESEKEKIERLAATQKLMIQRLASEVEARIHHLNQAIAEGCKVSVKQSRRGPAVPVSGARLNDEGAMEVFAGGEWVRCEWDLIEIGPSANAIANKVVAAARAAAAIEEKANKEKGHVFKFSRSFPNGV